MVSTVVGKCSICGRSVSGKFKPFCSSRCATVDLGRWFGEGYRAPSAEEAEESPLLLDHDGESAV